MKSPKTKPKKTTTEPSLAQRALVLLVSKQSWLPEAELAARLGLPKAGLAARLRRMARALRTYAIRVHAGPEKKVFWGLDPVTLGKKAPGVLLAKFNAPPIKVAARKAKAKIAA